MRATKIRVRNFRSIIDVSFDLKAVTVLFGPNSCGKSNVFRALCLAFSEEIARENVDNDLPRSRLGAGGGKLSIYVDVTFENVPAAVQEIVQVQKPTLMYSFRMFRKTGTVQRKLGGVFID